LVESSITFSTAAILIDTTKAGATVVSTLSSRGGIDFCAALSVISPPAVTISGISGIDHAVIYFNIARLAGTSEGADNEESSNKEESLELSHFFEEVVFVKGC